jgi:hypothetical protein
MSRKVAIWTLVGMIVGLLVGGLVQHGKWTREELFRVESGGKKRYVINTYDRSDWGLPLRVLLGRKERLSEYMDKTNYYVTGRVESYEQRVMGQRQGVLASWYEDGRMRSMGIFHEGLENGQKSEWYDNGNLKCSETYNAGKLVSAEYYDYQGKPTVRIAGGTGTAEQRDDAGSLITVCFYKDSVIDGYCDYYYRGKHEKRVLFQNGRPITDKPEAIRQ